MCLIRSMLQHPIRTAPTPIVALDIPAIVREISAYSLRPRYTFMVLDLIARVASTAGEAGPYVQDGRQAVPIREWLASAISPSAERTHQRKATTDAVEQELRSRGALPEDRAEARRIVAEEVAERVKASGKTAISRAVSELVRAGLLKRYYQGFRVDHENRGGQRLAVYTVPPGVRLALERRTPISKWSHAEEAPRFEF